MTSLQVSEIERLSDFDELRIPSGLSFFEPYLRYSVKEVLEVGGEAYGATEDADPSVSGVFIYDGSEKTGTIYTQSRGVFDHFYSLKPFNLLFAELEANEHENETYDIYSMDLESTGIIHRFRHEISMIGAAGDANDVEQFMVATHPGINGKWPRVALENGDRCFLVRLGDETAGAGWASLVNGIGRLHTLYVRPQFRRLGIGEDILHARLLWLKSRHARSVFTEISRYNLQSSANVMKAGMKPSGKVFQYLRRVDRATTTKLPSVLPSEH